MPLTIAQTLEIVKGNVKPQNNTLLDIVYQGALKLSKQIYDSPKIIADNPLGLSYQNKAYNVANQFFRNDPAALQSLNRIIITIISDNYTQAQVTGANDSAWEDVITQQMIRAFELLGGIKADEKAAYSSIQARK